jgi:PAX-interacting protein 1
LAVSTFFSRLFPEQKRHEALLFHQDRYRQLTQQYAQHGERLMVVQQQQQSMPDNPQLLQLVQQAYLQHQHLKQEIIQCQQVIKQLQPQVDHLQLLMQQQQQKEQELQKQLQQQQQQQQLQQRQEAKQDPPQFDPIKSLLNQLQQDPVGQAAAEHGSPSPSVLAGFGGIGNIQQSAVSQREEPQQPQRTSVWDIPPQQQQIKPEPQQEQQQQQQLHEKMEQVCLLHFTRTYVFSLAKFKFLICVLVVLFF